MHSHHWNFNKFIRKAASQIDKIMYGTRIFDFSKNLFTHAHQST